jgi:hypothetical protein
MRNIPVFPLCNPETLQIFPYLEKKNYVKAGKLSQVAPFLSWDVFQQAGTEKWYGLYVGMLYKRFPLIC